MNRFAEPSTWAGIGLFFQGAAALVASRGADQSGFAAIAAGIAAIFMREKAQVK